MITIKTNVYTNKERIALANVMEISAREFINKYCNPQTRCAECDYRHVCYDVLKARDYIVKLSGGVSQ